MTDLLPGSTEMSAVTLHVGDLAGQTEYYSRALGLTVLAEGPAGGLAGTRPEVLAAGAAATVLGRGTTPVVALVHTPGLPQPQRNQAGLFHTAVLFDGETELAAAVLSAAQHPRSAFVGSADHLVSQAFYFTDPEGNGIELYADRDRSTWGWDGDRVRMDTLYLDPQHFLAEHLTETAVESITDGGAKVGHVHLQVGDIAVARDFYVDALGFEVTADLPGALFVSAGGYHHHLAVNVWNSRGAGPRASTLGLGNVTITVPGEDDLAAVADRLRHRSLAVEQDGRAVRTQDPWRNTVTLELAA
jgi:catechol 2,3-dioxygenase